MKGKDTSKKKIKDIETTTKSSALIYFDKLQSINDEKDSSIKSNTQVNIVSDLSSNTACQDIFTFKVYNNSKKNAYISSIDIIDSEGVLNDITYVIKDSYDNIVEPGTILKNNTSTEYKIIVNSKEESCLSKEIKLSLKFNFVYGEYKEKKEVSNKEKTEQSEEKTITKSNTKTQIKTEKKKEQIAKVEKNKYTVTLNSVNGAYDVILMNVLENESINTRINSKEGYHYEKVTCSNNYNADVNDDNLSIKNIKENIDCTIYYIENNYKLNIDPNGGVYNTSTEVISEDRKYNSTIELDEPTKEGYTFAGWEIKEKIQS